MLSFEERNSMTPLLAGEARGGLFFSGLAGQNTVQHFLGQLGFFAPTFAEW